VKRSSSGADRTLRERKTTATRAQIIEVADQLFVAQGFDTVTLGDVAAECDASVRTVLRYFETKESLALAHEYAALDRFRAGLHEPGTGDVVSYWRHHVSSIAVDIAARPAWHRQRFELLSHSALYRRFLAIQRDYQAVLAAAIRDRATAPSHHLTPELLAVTLVVGTQSVLNEWLHGRQPFVPDRLLEAIDYSRELFADAPAAPSRRKEPNGEIRARQ
jgi:AcrR family transcriptional regulator